MQPIIEIKSISKKYRINRDRGQSYLSLRDSFTNILKKRTSSKEDFWSLQDISFDIYPGNSVGIIGRNGAGKSTLLKILSKITPPTSGKIISRGRIASLLEVGTGFHPELTGRENIYLNGSILGMTKREINSKFDEIVDFSGVEQFLDTPLKHYSSGMQLRLAFAVAAFLEPEILVIDEVLAVGDVEFQKKCMGKMGEVSKSGRTILFVSHNMNAITNLCNQAILLKEGRLISKGPTAQIIGKYLEFTSGEKNYERSLSQSSLLSILKCSLAEVSNNKVIVDLSIHSQLNIQTALNIRIKTYEGIPFAMASLGTYNKNEMIACKAGDNNLRCMLTLENWATGKYYISLDLSNPGVEYYERLEDILSFELDRFDQDDLVLLNQNWNCGTLMVNISKI